MFLISKVNTDRTPSMWGIFERESPPAGGSLDGEFFECATSLVRSRETNFLGALREVLATDAQWILISRNHKVILDRTLIGRVNSVHDKLTGLGEAIVLVSGGGLGLNHERYCVHYSSIEPFILFNPLPRPILDSMKELYIVAAQASRDLLAKYGDAFEHCFELALITEGYISQGRASLYLPELAAAVNGPFVGRDLVKCALEMAHLPCPLTTDPAIDTLAGPLHNPQADSATDQIGRREPWQRKSLQTALEPSIAAISDCPKVSIVTRTQFKRDYLLHRMLTSITRARLDRVPVEVVLSTDISEQWVDKKVAELQAIFPNIEVRLVVNLRDEHSRVANLIGGVEAATGEYIWFVDDDDYIDLDAFAKIATAFCAGGRPLIMGDSQVHDETWDLSHDRFPVLNSSVAGTLYAGTNWRNMFQGVNHLPICGPVIPRTFLLNRLEKFKFDFDLSEDYTLFLLLLCAPDLPPIVELSSVISHISIRHDGDNSVTTPDRTRWTRDISANLIALLYGEKSDGLGNWSGIMSQKIAHGDPQFLEQVKLLQDRLEQKDRQIAQMARQVEYFRELSKDAMLELTEVPPRIEMAAPAIERDGTGLSKSNKVEQI